MITKKEYKKAKKIVEQYENQKKHLVISFAEYILNDWEFFDNTKDGNLYQKRDNPNVIESIREVYIQFEKEYGA